MFQEVFLENLPLRINGAFLNLGKPRSILTAIARKMR